MTRFVVTLVTLIVVASSASLAQRADTLAAGVRLRLRPFPQSDWEYGTVRDTYRDSLDMQIEGSQETRRYALAEVAALQVYQEREGAQSHHAEIGALAGAFVATAFVVRDVNHCNATDHHAEGPPCAIGYVALPIVALGGAAVGAIVGVLGPTGHWRTLNVHQSH